MEIQYLIHQVHFLNLLNVYEDLVLKEKERVEKRKEEEEEDKWKYDECLHGKEKRNKKNKNK